MDYTVENEASKIKYQKARKKHRATQKARTKLTKAQRKRLGKKPGKKTGMCRRKKVVLKKMSRRLTWKGKKHE